MTKILPHKEEVNLQCVRMTSCLHLEPVSHGRLNMLKSLRITWNPLKFYICSVSFCFFLFDVSGYFLLYLSCHFLSPCAHSLRSALVCLRFFSCLKPTNNKKYKREQR